MSRIHRAPLNRSRKWVLAALSSYLLVLLLVPFGGLVLTVALSPQQALQHLWASDASSAFLRSIGLAFLAVGINLIMGLMGGIVLARSKFFGKGLLDILVELPLAVSPVMTGLSILLVYGRGGLLFPIFDKLGIAVVFAFPSLLIATLFVTLPFTVREVALVLQEIGDSEEQAAITLGASPWQTFWHITLPNAGHGLMVGATLTLSRALGEFGAVLVVGGAIAQRTQTATTFIHTAIEERHAPAAFGMALLLAAASMAILGILERRRTH